jgi:hypothetical protein
MQWFVSAAASVGVVALTATWALIVFQRRLPGSPALVTLFGVTLYALYFFLSATLHASVDVTFGALGIAIVLMVLLTAAITGRTPRPDGFGEIHEQHREKVSRSHVNTQSRS